MPDRDTFLRTIRAAPDDDTPRLMFADWLDERNDPLGEFVRVQVELERLRDEPESPRLGSLREREDELLNLHGADWLGGLADVTAEYPAFGPVFRRGLPELVCLSLDAFLSRGAELFAAAPTIREVSLYGVSGRGNELAACPFLNRVETLEIADPVYTDDPGPIGRLSAALRAARLRCLRVPEYFTPHFIYQFAGVVATGWPRWVEFVEYTPGPSAYARNHADALDRIAGRPVTRVARPAAARFPLLDPLGHGLMAGTLADGPPALAATAGGVLVVATFRADGSLIRANRMQSYRSAWTAGAARDRLGLTPGLIRVQPFRAERLAVQLWPRQYLADYLRGLSEPPPGVSGRAWRDRGGVLRRWLQHGRFAIEWEGREFFADRSGTIFSS